jgi:hypothetical protein
MTVFIIVILYLLCGLPFVRAVVPINVLLGVLLWTIWLPLAIIAFILVLRES